MARMRSPMLSKPVKESLVTLSCILDIKTPIVRSLREAVVLDERNCDFLFLKS